MGAGQPKTILVVEDDSDVRDALIELLEYRGHLVVGAANGREALDRLRSNTRPALILLDLMMPVIDGASSEPSSSATRAWHRSRSS